MKKIYCCQEHVEMAMDEVVHEYETYPTLNSISDDNELSTRCEYCRNDAIYIVGN
ncbi:CxxH/CxxC protein [Bacillus massiliglaciei]|uniref:CxxH/CxxC protein n=1 Tax=Bacillus massiliglaciei TaxID=1816693 RepID=UPI000DA6378D|nr:CxxH/CxxC protein [Bacillus massiliglaciei]